MLSARHTGINNLYNTTSLRKRSHTFQLTSEVFVSEFLLHLLKQVFNTLKTHQKTVHVQSCYMIIAQEKVKTGIQYKL